MSRDETVKFSSTSDGETHHEHLNADIDGERKANTSSSASHLTSTCDDESTRSYTIPHPRARGQSFDLEVVKRVKEDQQVSGSLVHTSSVFEPGLATADKNTASTQGIEDDVAQLATSVEVSAMTARTSLTTVTNPAEATVDRSNDDDRFVIKKLCCRPVLTSS